jgi:hypothetical protein
MKYIFIVIIIKCINLISGELMQAFSKDLDDLDDNICGISQNGEIWKRINKQYI